MIRFLRRALAPAALLALSAALRPGFRTLTISLMFLAFPTQAKVARANTLTYANREFVLAARAMGAKSRRIIVNEIVPNVALPFKGSKASLSGKHPATPVGSRWHICLGERVWLSSSWK